jgi:hypothetical protein
MPTVRPFAYNTGATISGTIKFGNLSIGASSLGYATRPGDVQWWNGPDEDLGYVIAQPVPSGTQPNPIGISASVGFWRSGSKSDASFIDIVNTAYKQNFVSGASAAAYLSANGYWTSYASSVPPVLSLDASTYSGSGSTWTDSIGGKQFTLFNSPAWSSSNGGYFTFAPASSQYAQATSLTGSLSTWTVEAWHYYEGTSGGLPTIVTENYPGSTSQINYNLGSATTTGLQSAFFNGSWRTTPVQALSLNTWYHIVGTYDGTTIKLYVNSTMVQSTNYTGNPISSQGGIRLMRRWDNPDYWGGRLSIVNIYNYAISDTQVSSNWNSTKSRFGL